MTVAPDIARINFPFFAVGTEPANAAGQYRGPATDAVRAIPHRYGTPVSELKKR